MCESSEKLRTFLEDDCSISVIKMILRFFSVFHKMQFIVQVFYQTYIGSFTNYFYFTELLEMKVQLKLAEESVSFELNANSTENIKSTSLDENIFCGFQFCKYLCELISVLFSVIIWFDIFVIVSLLKIIGTLSWIRHKFNSQDCE